MPQQTCDSSGKNGCFVRDFVRNVVRGNFRESHVTSLWFDVKLKSRNLPDAPATNCFIAQQGSSGLETYWTVINWFSRDCEKIARKTGWVRKTASSWSSRQLRTHPEDDAVKFTKFRFGSIWPFSLRSSSFLHACVSIIGIRAAGLALFLGRRSTQTRNHLKLSRVIKPTKKWLMTWACEDPHWLPGDVPLWFWFFARGVLGKSRKLADNAIHNCGAHLERDPKGTLSQPSQHSFMTLIVT